MRHHRVHPSYGFAASDADRNGYLGARVQDPETDIQRPIGYLDPEATKINVAGLHRLLIEMNLLRDGTLEESEVVFCEWPRYEHFRQLRSERNLTFRLNQIPEASEVLQQKQLFAYRFRRGRYMLKTYLESGPRWLRGLWVEKPNNVDRGEGITFLRAPRRWARPDHLLQRYLERPWLIDGRKTEARVIARINDDGSALVYPEGLVRVAHLPYTLADLDPLIHNSNLAFQQRMGIEVVEQHLLTERAPFPGLIDQMVAIVHDTVSVLRRKERFLGTGDFEAMGYDFVVSRRGRPYLLEANRFPGLYFDQGVAERFYRGMIQELYREL